MASSSTSNPYILQVISPARYGSGSLKNQLESDNGRILKLNYQINGLLAGEPEQVFKNDQSHFRIANNYITGLNNLPYNSKVTKATNLNGSKYEQFETALKELEDELKKQNFTIGMNGFNAYGAAELNKAKLKYPPIVTPVSTPALAPLSQDDFAATLLAGAGTTTPTQPPIVTFQTPPTTTFIPPSPAASSTTEFPSPAAPIVFEDFVIPEDHDDDYVPPSLHTEPQPEEPQTQVTAITPVKLTAVPRMRTHGDFPEMVFVSDDADLSLANQEDVRRLGRMKGKLTLSKMTQPQATEYQESLVSQIKALEKKISEDIFRSMQDAPPHLPLHPPFLPPDEANTIKDVTLREGAIRFSIPVGDYRLPLRVLFYPVYTSNQELQSPLEGSGVVVATKNIYSLKENLSILRKGEHVGLVKHTGWYVVQDNAGGVYETVKILSVYVAPNIRYTSTDNQMPQVKPIYKPSTREMWQLDATDLLGPWTVAYEGKRVITSAEVPSLSRPSNFFGVVTVSFSGVVLHKIFVRPANYQHRLIENVTDTIKLMSETPSKWMQIDGLSVTSSITTVGEFDRYLERRMRSGDFATLDRTLPDETEYSVRYFDAPRPSPVIILLNRENKTIYALEWRIPKVQVEVPFFGSVVQLDAPMYAVLSQYTLSWIRLTRSLTDEPRTEVQETHLSVDVMSPKDLRTYRLKLSLGNTEAFPGLKFLYELVHVEAPPSFNIDRNLVDTPIMNTLAKNQGYSYRTFQEAAQFAGEYPSMVRYGAALTRVMNQYADNTSVKVLTALPTSLSGVMYPPVLAYTPDTPLSHTSSLDSFSVLFNPRNQKWVQIDKDQTALYELNPVDLPPTDKQISSLRFVEKVPLYDVYRGFNPPVLDLDTLPVYHLALSNNSDVYFRNAEEIRAEIKAALGVVVPYSYVPSDISRYIHPAYSVLLTPTHKKTGIEEDFFKNKGTYGEVEKDLIRRALRGEKVFVQYREDYIDHLSKLLNFSDAARIFRVTVMADQPARATIPKETIDDLAGAIAIVESRLRGNKDFSVFYGSDDDAAALDVVNIAPRAVKVATASRPARIPASAMKTFASLGSFSAYFDINNIEKVFRNYREKYLDTLAVAVDGTDLRKNYLDDYDNDNDEEFGEYLEKFDAGIVSNDPAVVNEIWLKRFQHVPGVRKVAVIDEAKALVNTLKLLKKEFYVAVADMDKNFPFGNVDTYTDFLDAYTLAQSKSLQYNNALKNTTNPYVKNFIGDYLWHQHAYSRDDGLYEPSTIVFSTVMAVAFIHYAYYTVFKVYWNVPQASSLGDMTNNIKQYLSRQDAKISKLLSKAYVPLIYDLDLDFIRDIMTQSVHNKVNLPQRMLNYWGVSMYYLQPYYNLFSSPRYPDLLSLDEIHDQLFNVKPSQTLKSRIVDLIVNRVFKGGVTGNAEIIINQFASKFAAGSDIVREPASSQADDILDFWKQLLKVYVSTLPGITVSRLNKAKNAIDSGNVVDLNAALAPAGAFDVSQLKDVDVDDDATVRLFAMTQSHRVFLSLTTKEVFETLSEKNQDALEDWARYFDQKEVVDIASKRVRDVQGVAKFFSDGLLDGDADLLNIYSDIFPKAWPAVQPEVNVDAFFAGDEPYRHYFKLRSFINEHLKSLGVSPTVSPVFVARAVTDQFSDVALKAIQYTFWTSQIENHGDNDSVVFRPTKVNSPEPWIKIEGLSRSATVWDAEMVEFHNNVRSNSNQYFSRLDLVPALLNKQGRVEFEEVKDRYAALQQFILQHDLYLLLSFMNYDYVNSKLYDLYRWYQAPTSQSTLWKNVLDYCWKITNADNRDATSGSLKTTLGTLVKMEYNATLQKKDPANVRRAMNVLYKHFAKMVYLLRSTESKLPPLTKEGNFDLASWFSVFSNPDMSLTSFEDTVVDPKQLITYISDYLKTKQTSGFFGGKNEFNVILQPSIVQFVNALSADYNLNISDKYNPDHPFWINVYLAYLRMNFEVVDDSGSQIAWPKKTAQIFSETFYLPNVKLVPKDSAEKPSVTIKSEPGPPVPFSPNSEPGPAIPFSSSSEPSTSRDTRPLPSSSSSSSAPPPISAQIQRITVKELPSYSIKALKANNAQAIRDTALTAVKPLSRNGSLPINSNYQEHVLVTLLGVIGTVKKHQLHLVPVCFLEMQYPGIWWKTGDSKTDLGATFSNMLKTLSGKSALEQKVLYQLIRNGTDVWPFDKYDSSIIYPVGANHEVLDPSAMISAPEYKTPKKSSLLTANDTRDFIVQGWWINMVAWIKRNDDALKLLSSQKK